MIYCGRIHKKSLTKQKVFQSGQIRIFHPTRGWKGHFESPGTCSFKNLLQRFEYSLVTLMLQSTLLFECILGRFLGSKKYLLKRYDWSTRDYTTKLCFQENKKVNVLSFAAVFFHRAGEFTRLNDNWSFDYIEIRFRKFRWWWKESFPTAGLEVFWIVRPSFVEEFPSIQKTTWREKCQLTSKAIVNAFYRMGLFEQTVVFWLDIYQPQTKKPGLYLLHMYIYLPRVCVSIISKVAYTPNFRQ